MTPEERQARFKVILDNHDRAVAAYRRATREAKIAGMKATLGEMTQLLAAQDIAIQAVLDANRAAIALLDDERTA